VTCLNPAAKQNRKDYSYSGLLLVRQRAEKRATRTGYDTFFFAFEVLIEISVKRLQGLYLCL